MILPNWTVPAQIKACTLVRHDPIALMSLPFPILRLQQVHGSEVINWDQSLLAISTLDLEYLTSIQADGCYTTRNNIACAVYTADCLPVLITNKNGTEVAALHAGWRGLAAGIIEQGIKKFNASTQDLIVWLGPAICAQHYEVGTEVYDSFVATNPALITFFSPTRPGHWHADIPAIAKFKLEQLGVQQIFQYQGCTFEDANQLYSYRREKDNAGRLCHLIWIDR